MKSLRMYIIIPLVFLLLTSQPYINGYTIGEIKNDYNLKTNGLVILKIGEDPVIEKGFKNLATKIETEQSYLTAEFKKWQELIDRNASLLERINMVELESFIKEANKLRDMTLEN